VRPLRAVSVRLAVRRATRVRRPTPGR